MSLQRDVEIDDWRGEVRAFLRRNITDGLRRELGRGEAIPRLGVNQPPHVMEFRQRVIEQGWLGLALPTEYGGLGKSALEQYVLITEFQRAGVPNMSLTVTSLGPTIAKYGTDDNKKMWLPGVISGEIEMALGYSEPEAGTDLANLATRGTLGDGKWSIDGQKIWNSGAHSCTHEWLAVRTDPDAPKHRGISIIVVPIDAEGIDVQPLWTWGDVRTNLTSFSNVSVSQENLIGDRDRGWQYIVAALDFERVSIGGYLGQAMAAFDRLLLWCTNTVVDGRLPASRPDVRRKLAELERDIAVADLFGLHTVQMIDAGEIPSREASQHKVLVTELLAKFADYGTQIQGLYGQLDRADPWAPSSGTAEVLYRQAPYLRFGGGTNEIQRDIIAQRGFGLPRA